MGARESFAVIGPNRRAANGASDAHRSLLVKPEGKRLRPLWLLFGVGLILFFWFGNRGLNEPDERRYAQMPLSSWNRRRIGGIRECQHRNGAWGFWFPSLVFWTLAFWTKATPALVPLFGLVTGVWILDDGAGKKALRLGILLPRMLVLGSPWYLRMLLEHPDLVSFWSDGNWSGVSWGASRVGTAPAIITSH